MWGTIGFIIVSLGFYFFGYPRPSVEGSILTSFLVSGSLFLVAIPFLPRAETTASDRGARTAGGPGRMPRAFWIVVAIVFFSNAGFSSHAAFFSLYVTDMLPGFLVSIAWSIGAIAEIPAMLYGGRLIRRFGVRAMLVTATLAQVVRLVLYAVAPQTGPVLAAQLLHVFTFGLLHTAGIGFVSRTIAPGSRARAVALYNAIGFGLPGLLGGVLGGQLLEAFGFSTLFLAFAALPFAGAMVGIVAGSRIEREAA